MSPEYNDAAYVTRYDATAYETRTTYGNKDGLHLVLVDEVTFTPNGDVVWKDKYRHVEIHNLSGKYIMRLSVSDVSYLGTLCNAIKETCLNMNDENKE